MSLDVCMVIGQGRTLAVGVLDFTERLPVRALIEHDDEPYKSGRWVRRVAQLRTKALRRVRSDYWLSLDADVIVSADAVIGAMAWLQYHPDWAGVGFWMGGPELPKDADAPPQIGCALFRTFKTWGLEFREHRVPGDPVIQCECECFADDLRAKGWIYRYHPDFRARHMGG